MVNMYPQAIEKNRNEYSEVATSPYVKNYSIERKQRLVALLAEDARILKFHQSLCPGCVDEEKFDRMKIDSVTFARHNKVWIMKQCEEHGVYKELSWGDYEMYKKAERFQDPGIKILNPHIDKSQFEIDCPTDCGLCVEHESHTGLGNIVVTNRCDLTCWYCLPFNQELLVRLNGAVKMANIGDLVESGMAGNAKKIKGMDGFQAVPRTAT